MFKVEITIDNFMIGLTKIAKGEVVEVAPPIARYIEKSGQGKVIGEVVEKKVVKKAAVKKATYKTRDMKADK